MNTTKARKVHLLKKANGVDKECSRGFNVGWLAGLAVTIEEAHLVTCERCKAALARRLAAKRP